MGKHKNIDVLIIGAGPSGLMMAAQLLRHGVQPVIIDQRTGPDRDSKALVLQARTMEFFRQLGLDGQLMAHGMTCEGIQLQEGKAVWGHVGFDLADEPKSHFPSLLTIGQNHVERVLTQVLTENTCAIRWNKPLVSLRQNDREVIVTVGKDSSQETWCCKWVVGADGADSGVREMAGIASADSSKDMPMLLAEMQLEEGRNRRIHLFLSKKKQFLALLPFGEAGNYRLVGSVSARAGEQDLKMWVDDILGFELPVARYRWCKDVQIQPRMAADFRQQRCVLVGDAAHVFPYGLGLGLNIGMQEAVNLAWKLAGVVNRRYKPELVFSYGEERKPVAQRAMSMSDAVRRSVLEKPWMTYRWFWNRFRRGMIAALAKPEMAIKIESNVAQWDVDYKTSALSVHHSTQSGVQAGDRLPYQIVFDEKQKADTDLHAWCAKAGFVLLVLGTVSHHNLRIISQWMKQKYPRDMHLFYLPYSERNRNVFDQFSMHKHMTKMLLVRPDMHIAYINDTLNTGLIDNYMEEVIGWGEDTPAFEEPVNKTKG